MFGLIRLSIYLVSRRWGWYLLGAILLVAGVVVGLTSHQVAYQIINKGSFTPYIVQGGTDYLQTNNGSTYYVINESEFSPAFNGSSVFKNSGSFTMIARSDTQDVDVQLTDGTHLQGTGYKVEQVVILDSSGNPAQTFNDSEYTQNPKGFYENNWASGVALIVFGLIAGIAGFFVPQMLKNRRKAAPAAPFVQGQPMQSMPQYQQPYPAYPPQNPVYQQPNIPYPQQNPYQPYQQPSQASQSYQQPYTDPSQYQQPYTDPSQYQGFMPEQTPRNNPYDPPKSG
jgi:hypothetical protein